MNDTRLWVSELLAAFSGQGNVLTIPRPYIEVTGNIEDALLLSQIIYWTDRTTMGDGWFAKSYSDWKDEIALSKYQVMAATKRLHDAGVETIVKKFKGFPTVHYRLRKLDFELWIVKKLNERKLSNSTNDSKETLQSSTENTAEPTTEIITATASIPSVPTKPKPKSIAPTTEQCKALIQAWVESTGLIDIGASYDTQARLKKAKAMLLWATPVTVDEIRIYTKWLCTNKKNTEFNFYPDGIPLWRSANAPKPVKVIDPNKPMTEAEYILKQIEREGESYGRAS